MALTAKIKTPFGEERACYIRLNSVEASNHGVESVALFRAFLDKAAFEDGATYVAEYSVGFTPDVAKPLWKQAYAALVETEGFAKKEV